MPLERGKSDAALSRNIATERRAGRPEKQAVAIAFNVRRHSGGKDQMDKRLLFRGAVRDALRRGATAMDALKSGCSALGDVVSDRAASAGPAPQDINRSKLVQRHLQSAREMDELASHNQRNGRSRAAEMARRSSELHRLAARFHSKEWPAQGQRVARQASSAGRLAARTGDARLRRTTLHAHGERTMHSDAAASEWPHDRSVVQKLAEHHAERARAYSNSAANARGRGWHGIATQHELLASAHNRAAASFREASALKDQGRHKAAREASEGGYRNAARAEGAERRVGYAGPVPSRTGHGPESLHRHLSGSKYSSYDAVQHDPHSGQFVGQETHGTATSHGWEPTSARQSGTTFKHPVNPGHTLNVGSTGRWEHRTRAGTKLVKSGHGPESLHRHLSGSKYSSYDAAQIEYPAMQSDARMP